MKKSQFSFLPNKLGVSYAISAVIMTAVTITLVLVASTYTYQLLEQQRGATEFDVAKTSLLAFDDALENIAWKPQASRSTRFTVKYGQLELMPNDALRGMPLVVNVIDYPDASYSDRTGYIRYSTKTKYANFGENYTRYLLGNDRTLSNGAGSYGRALIEQKSDWANITLTYGVRAMKTSTIEVNNTLVNSVDIWITRINITDWSTNIGDFDLKAKCLSVRTEPRVPSDFDGLGYRVQDGQCNITVQLGDNLLDTASIELDGERVVFNFVIATVQVSV